MIPQQGTWGDLEPGRHIKDSTGKTWKVTGINRVAIRVVDREGTEQIFRVRERDAPVTLVVPTMDDAVRNIATILGGRVIGA